MSKSESHVKLTHARQENIVSMNTLTCISELCVQMARTLGWTTYITWANCAIQTFIKLKKEGWREHTGILWNAVGY